MALEMCHHNSNIRNYTRHVQKTIKLSLHGHYCSFYNILSTVPFKVVPSTGDTLFPTFLPLLESFLEGTFCDGTQFSYCIFLNLLYGLEMTSFQSGFKFGKQEKVCWGKVQRIGWMGHNGCLMFCQITVDEERRVSWRIVMVQYPSLVFPQFRPLPAHSIPQMR